MAGSWSVFVGDPAKLALSVISVLYDLVFIVQHYCLYGEAKTDKEDQSDRVLVGKT
jgi:cystinosin